MEDIFIILWNSIWIKIIFAYAFGHFLNDWVKIRFTEPHFTVLTPTFWQKTRIILLGIILFALFFQPTSVTPKNKLDVIEQDVDAQVQERIEKAGPPKLVGTGTPDYAAETAKFRDQFRERQNETLSTIEPK